MARSQRIRTLRQTEQLMPTIERIIPVLTYRDIPAAHDFLVQAFGFVAIISILPSRSMWQTPAWSSTWMMSTRTTSALGRRVPASTASRSISRMVSVNMEHETRKVTGGGLRHQ